MPRIQYFILYCYLSQVLAIVTYPVTLGGFSGDTVLQGFAIHDISNDLLVAAKSNDPDLVSIPNANIALRMQPSASDTWIWTVEFPF